MSVIIFKRDGKLTAYRAGREDSIGTISLVGEDKQPIDVPVWTDLDKISFDDYRIVALAALAQDVESHWDLLSFADRNITYANKKYPRLHIRIGIDEFFDECLTVLSMLVTEPNGRADLILTHVIEVRSHLPTAWVNSMLYHLNDIAERQARRRVDG